MSPFSYDKLSSIEVLNSKSYTVTLYRFIFTRYSKPTAIILKDDGYDVSVEIKYITRDNKVVNIPFIFYKEDSLKIFKMIDFCVNDYLKYSSSAKRIKLNI